MHAPIAPDHLHILLEEADAAARKLRRKLNLPGHDLDDLRQELLADLIARLPAYDPARGPLGAFAGVVLRNMSTRIAVRTAKERRLLGAAPVSLDAPLPGGDGETFGDLVSEAEGLSAWHGQPTDALGDVERRIDLERALGAVARRDAALCARLSDQTADHCAADGLGSRATLYRRLRELRHLLAMRGLRAA